MNEKDWQSFVDEADSVKQAMLLARVSNDASEKADQQNRRLWKALGVSVLVNLIGIILAVCLTIYMQAHAQEMLNTGLETALQTIAEIQIEGSAATNETTLTQDTGEGSGNNVYQDGENATYSKGDA